MSTEEPTADEGGSSSDQPDGAHPPRSAPGGADGAGASGGAGASAGAYPVHGAPGPEAAETAPQSSHRAPLLAKTTAGEPAPSDPATSPGRPATAVDGTVAGGATLEQITSSARYTPSAGTHERTRRFWSSRRVPAALLALAVLGASGLLLYDVAAVRADRSAMRWRRRLSDELATRPLDDPWIVAGASVAVALGLWLVLLALTPGRRGVLPMRPDPQVRAGLDRSAAALVLRDRAMEVPGVRTVRVDAGRRRVKVRALAHFRELDEVRSDLDAALDDGIRQLGLARRPGLRVQVRRPTRK